MFFFMLLFFILLFKMLLYKVFLFKMLLFRVPLFLCHCIASYIHSCDFIQVACTIGVDSFSRDL